MRINKYLATQGVATRRAADDLISAGKVYLNGRKAVLGDQVEEGDKVEVKGARQREYAYFAYNKPRGVVSHSAQEGEDDIETRVAHDTGVKGVFPVGRLDKDSYGLIILTNDGRVTDRLLNPDKEHDKEYVVRVKEPLRDSFKKNMEMGVDIEGYQTRPCKVKVLTDNTFSITLTEGKKHQIRRMVVALHNETIELRRVRVLNIELGNMKSGGLRPIEGDELAEFLELLGL